ncbi:MAG: DUF3500 domain-containing protein, partial [Pirellulales bacterium]
MPATPTRRQAPLLVVALILLGLLATAGVAAFRLVTAGEALSGAATAWLAGLDEVQRARAQADFEAASRTDWHFVPKPVRKGLSFAEMTAAQREQAHALLKAALSEAGYGKAVAIMELDELLRRVEGTAAKNTRDSLRYFVTIFGVPGPEGSWGLSVEGHHLSLNFTVRDGVLVDSTPQFMGANPAEVKTTFPGLAAAGSRVLAAEESLAFELVTSLDAEQRKRAVIAAQAPAEIRGAGAAQPPAGPPEGIPFSKLSADQQSLVRRLVETYCGSMPAEVAGERLAVIERGSPATAGLVHHGWDELHFAWAGGLEPGKGHSYRLEGPSFVVEFVNVQPDAEGNPANHIHCVWRD